MEHIVDGTYQKLREEFMSFHVQHQKIIKNFHKTMTGLNDKLLCNLSELREGDFRRQVSEIQAELDVMIDKLWYGRHQSSRYDVEHEGKYVDPKVWKGALACAVKFEEKYGIENLQFSRFEWGMLNGKISALRWISGEDWDELYN